MTYESETKNSWATINDLYERYGEEYINKLSIRRNFDDSIGEYIADESESNITRIQLIALQDAKERIKFYLSQNFDNVSLLDTIEFYGIKLYHVLYTIEFLKIGGDCKPAEQKLRNFLDMKGICSDKICLPRKKKLAFKISEAKFDCEGGHGCK